MKKLIIPLALCLISITCLSQNNISRYEQEIKVSPPVFTGSEYYEMSNDRMLRSYILQKMEYPLNAERCIIEGKTVIQFNVDEKGNVSKIKFANSLCPEIDKEIQRVLLTTNGMWKPGLNNDEPVEMPKELVVVFAYSGSSDETIQQLFKERAITCFKAGTKKLYQKQNVKKALYHFNRGLRYMPFDQSLLLSRGMCLYELGDLSGAYNDWNRVLSSGGVDMNDIALKSHGLKGEKALAELLKEQ